MLLGNHLLGAQKWNTYSALEAEGITSHRQMGALQLARGSRELSMDVSWKAAPVIYAEHRSIIINTIRITIGGL